MNQSHPDPSITPLQTVSYLYYSRHGQFPDDPVKMDSVHIPSTELGSQFVKEGKTASATAASATVADRRDIVVVGRYGERAGSRRRCVGSPILHRAAGDGRPVHDATLEVHVVAGRDHRRCRGKSRAARSGRLVRRTAFTTSMRKIITTSVLTVVSAYTYVSHLYRVNTRMRLKTANHSM